MEGIRPIPMKSLPLLKTSRVAPILAKIDGCLYILPFSALANAGFNITIASVKGGNVPIDPYSVP